MSRLNYTRHEKISLRDHPDFSESWLHDRIVEDPAILGLTNVEVLDRERRHEGAGRLDLLLSDQTSNRRYEVEVMLGQTDPSHIMRCIEYWDIERGRYPAYDHVAVLIAERVTGRYLNLLSLFAGSIPLVVFQLDALKVGEQIVLNFVRVLDQTWLRRDDETSVTTSATAATTRDYWLEYSGPEIVGIVDRVLAMINEKADAEYRLNYKQQYVGLSDGNRSRNFVWFGPRKRFCQIDVTVADAGPWQARLDEAGLPAAPHGNWLRVTVVPNEFAAHEDLLRELVHQAVQEY